jgi:hypothetical protein
VFTLPLIFRVRNALRGSWVQNLDERIRFMISGEWLLSVTHALRLWIAGVI